jgi:hypothetical protein
MAKRFTDTDKWKKPFIRGLDTPYKLLWFYIIDDCDHAGIWQVDIEVAEIRTGEKLDEKKALEFFKDRVIRLSNSKWFIPDFITFQYGELKETNRMHLSVIQLLAKNGIDFNNLNKPLISPLEGVKDKEQDKDKEKDKVKEKDCDYEILEYPSFDDFWELYDKKVDKVATENKWKKLTQEEKEQAIEYIPQYKLSEPDKTFRKNPLTFINNKSWNNEIITKARSGNDAKIPLASSFTPEDFGM